MKQLSQSHLNRLIDSSNNSFPSPQSVAGDPFVSLYIPKEALHDQAQNPQRLHHLITKAESLIAKHFPGKKAHLSNIYGKLVKAISDSQTASGFAVFESKNLSGFFPISGKVRELAVVGNSFHVKPLLNEIQNQNKFYALTLDTQMVYLWEGNSHSIEKKAVYTIPQNQNPKVGSNAQKNTFQRQEVRVILKFYKDVIQRVKKQVKNQYDPIYIVAQPHLRALFMGISRQKNLLQHPSLDMDPRSLTASDLHQVTWGVASKELYRRTRRIVKDYPLYQLSGRTLESLTEIARAAAAGQIESLQIQKDLYIWGEYQKSSGKIHYAESSSAQPIDDIFDDIAEDVIRRGGQVYLLEAQDMPRNLSAWAVVKKRRKPLGYFHQ